MGGMSDDEHREVNDEERDAEYEQREVDDVVTRVSARFPQLPVERVRELVLAELGHFQAATVRDFVPVLVETQVMDKLRAVEEPAAIVPPGEDLSAGPDATDG